MRISKIEKKSSYSEKTFLPNVFWIMLVSLVYKQMRMYYIYYDADIVHCCHLNAKAILLKFS